MKLLVVGGAGYIGSHNVKLFLESGHDVIVVDNLTTGHMAAVDQRARFYRCDIRDKENLKRIFLNEKPDCVVHFAALSLVGVSVTQPLEYFSNNVYGMQILLEVMRETGVGKIVFSSSAAVYGDVKEMPISEDTPACPVNPYGETKLTMEKMMRWCDAAYGMRYVSLRYFNAAGSYGDGTIGEDHDPETHLIPLILRVPLGKRDHVSVYGKDYPTKDGTCIRDYIHIMDLADAHVRAVDYLANGGKSDVFNLGTGDGQSVNEMIAAAEKAVGAPIKKEYVGRRAGDPAKLVASNRKAGEILGWKPVHSLDDIMSSAWAFHSAHPDGYGDR